MFFTYFTSRKMMNYLVLVLLVCFISNVHPSMIMSVQHAKNYNNKRADELRYTVYQAIRTFDKAKFGVAFAEYAELSDNYSDMYRWAASRKSKTYSEHFTVKNYQKIQGNKIKKLFLIAGCVLIADTSAFKFYDNFIAKESLFDFSAYNLMKAALGAGLATSVVCIPYFYNFVKAGSIVKERKEATEFFAQTIHNRMEETLAAKDLWDRSEQRRIQSSPFENRNLTSLSPQYTVDNDNSSNLLHSSDSDSDDN